MTENLRAELTKPRIWGTRPDGIIVFPWCGCWIVYHGWEVGCTATVGDDGEFESEHGLPISDERAQAIVDAMPTSLVRAITEAEQDYRDDAEGDPS